MIKTDNRITALLAYKDRPVNVQYCLGSINCCNPRPYVILTDFGSKEGIKKFEKKYDWLTVVHVDRKTDFFHKARAYNIGIRHTKTKYICATDIDQIFNPNFFGEVIKALLSNSKPFIMCRTHFWRKPLPEGLTPDNISAHYFELLNELKGTKIGGEGCCMGFPTTWIKQVRGWDEGYIGQGPEDSDVMLRALLSGYRRIWITNRTNMIHLPHGRNTGYLRNYIKQNRARYFRRKNITKDVVVNKNLVWGQL
jgi:GT2 family glycosyltransferase